MNDEYPDEMAIVLADADAVNRTEAGYRITATAFEGTLEVTGSEVPGWTVTLSVRVPSLDSVTTDRVTPAVETDWLRTLQRRLEDAPMATRRSVTLDAFSVEPTDGHVDIEYTYTHDSAQGAVDIASTFAEYVEGTYVETVIPGYEYEPPVSDLLSDATDGEKGGTPL